MSKRIPLLIVLVLTTSLFAEAFFAARIPNARADFVPDAYTLALWHFNEGSGQIVYDASSHHNDGTLGPTSSPEERDPSWAPGRTGQPGDYGISFDEWYDYVLVPDNPDGSLDLPVGGAFTIEFYAYIRQISRADRGFGYHWNFFMGKNNMDYDQLSGYWLHQCTIYPRVEAYVRDDDGNTHKVASAKEPPTNRWVHMAWTYDGQYLRYFLNGLLQGERNVGPFTDTGNTYPLTLGKSLTSDLEWRDSVDCIMDEVRISSCLRILPFEARNYNEYMQIGDYAPAGIPDFDQRQWGTYNWTDGGGAWSHCGPVAIANSLWWLDTINEPHPIPPPVINDGFPIVKSYGPWDDHDVNNVPMLVENLTYLMDTNGIRTGLAHTGTNLDDVKVGLAQYLTWSGINPYGDVNGDGTTDLSDTTIMQAAYGSVPGSPNWNMAADIYPSSYPSARIDHNSMNKVDIADVTLAAYGYNHTGSYKIDLLPSPNLNEDIDGLEVLLLGYWNYGGGWYREDGHYVTVANVSTANSKITICDPYYDAYESGLIPEGRVPFPHTHSPPEPPYVTHNDAAFMSQDTYSYTYVSPPLPPCPGGNCSLVNYVGWWQPPPPLHVTVIEAAIVISPIKENDVAITNIKHPKTGCLPMPTLGRNYTLQINVTIENQGDHYPSGTFNVFLECVSAQNYTLIGTQTVTNLAPYEKAQLTFNWNTTGQSYGNYTITATTGLVNGEVDAADNTLTGGSILVTLPGDIDGNKDVNVLDAIRLSNSMDPVPGEPGWNPNADLNTDYDVNILDCIILSNYMPEPPWS